MNAVVKQLSQLNKEVEEANAKIDAAEEAYQRNEESNVYDTDQLKVSIKERVDRRDKLIIERAAVTVVASLPDVLPGELMFVCM